MTKKYILASLNIIIFIIFLILLSIGLWQIKIFSNIKTILIIIGLIITLAISIYLYFNKKIKLYNIGIFITFLLNIILLYNIIDLNYKYNYLSNTTNQKYQYLEYNIYVQKKNVIYSNIKKLNNKKIGTLDNNKNISQYLNKIINIECIEYNTIEELTYAIENGEIQSFIINEEEYNNIPEDNSIKDKVRIIFTTKIKNDL